MVSAQGLLDRWAIEDGIDPAKISFEGYDFRSKKTLGYCQLDRYGISHIHLNEKLRDHPLCATETLWHEYSHAWNNDDGKPDGHGCKFWRHYFKRPWMILIYLVSGFVIM